MDHGQRGGGVKVCAQKTAAGSQFIHLSLHGDLKNPAKKQSPTRGQRKEANQIEVTFSSRLLGSNQSTERQTRCL